MKNHSKMLIVLSLGISTTELRSAYAAPATINWDDLEEDTAETEPAPQGTPSAADKLKASFFHQAVKNLPPEEKVPPAETNQDTQAPVKDSGGSNEKSEHLRPSPWRSSK